MKQKNIQNFVSQNFVNTLGAGLGVYWLGGAIYTVCYMWSPSTHYDFAGKKQDNIEPCILFLVMGPFGPLFFPYITRERTAQKCTLF